MIRIQLSLISLFCLSIASIAQTDSLSLLAFYNVENLFDTVNDSLIFDDDRTPEGRYGWTSERYNKKIEQLAQVISGIGAYLKGSFPDIVGLCEVENAGVLKDLVAHTAIRQARYAILHMDSPDERGMDVAMLYRPEIFIPISFRAHRLRLLTEKLRSDRTRDQLVVTGWLESELLGLIINHWPSRRGGQTRSAPNRLKAARLNRRIIDSLRREHPDITLISMGDFNDAPSDKSLKILTRPDQYRFEELYNPMAMLSRKGYGTLAYRDQWSVFDQILLDKKLQRPFAYPWKFRNAGIYATVEMVIRKGRYKGYPYSTYLRGMYQGGVSDHFPVYVVLKRSADQENH